MKFQNSPTGSTTEATEADVTQLVDRFISARTISYSQYRELSRTVLADGTVDERERYQINRLFDAIQKGMVKLVD
ncbi:MAG: hypothetical protein HC873_01675 [Leptolyngbyaceae cyanobacterium SL_1_1]|nr:hypothetical protein [Leptolyngbyaceae cyanobacterium RM1_1_2]NJO08562.1 hypothetical protein [Leptolyngbyaceae cyanobacterium SL_1_1]